LLLTLENFRKFEENEKEYILDTTGML